MLKARVIESPVAAIEPGSGTFAAAAAAGPVTTTKLITTAEIPANARSRADRDEVLCALGCIGRLRWKES
jgi:hypothetical protein